MKTAALLAAVAAAATAVPAIATEVADGLPVNRWTLLPEAAAGPASYNGLVYAPELGRVIRWRWSTSAGQGSVEAFDAAKGEWIPEGSSVSFPQEADEKRRRLLTVSNGCSWDSKRGEVVYTMAGRMVAYHGFGGALEPYNGRFFPGEIYFSSLDTSRGELTVRKVAPGPERDPNEDRPFCYVAGRNRVFFYEWDGDGNGVRRQGTWVYDVEANRFEDLRPERQPPGSARTVESIESQDAIYAVIGDGEQWVYSFRRNAWAPLPTESDAEMRFASPYAQVVYSAKYGVLVNVGAHSGGTAVMRPDLSRIAWDGA